MYKLEPRDCWLVLALLPIPHVCLLLYFSGLVSTTIQLSHS